MNKLERIKKRLRGLKQNQNKSEEELDLLAKEKIEEEQIIDNLTFCIDNKEKKFAANLLKKYLSESSIETEADKDTLRQLIDLQIQCERIKDFLKTEYNKANPAIPTQMLEELRKTNEQVLLLKEKIGLINRDRQQSTWQDEWKSLKKKALNYYETHKAEYIAKCPYCNKLFQYIIRTKDYKAIKSIWFKETTLYNRPLFNLYHNKKLTREQMAEIFGVSYLYIDFIYKDLYMKELDDDRKN